MIARALLYEVSVLFRYEPTQGFDPIAACEAGNEFDQHNQEGIVILSTTQIPKDANQLFGYVVYTVNIHIVTNDTPKSLTLV
jgi:ABC-type multidrug transport system ATPase subunit